MKNYICTFILVIDGYFHKQSKFSAYPCDDNNSFSNGDHCNAHTCDPVSTEFNRAPDWAFQNLIHLSAVPPPVASKFLS